MNAVVVYKTKSGFTKQYAEWIAEDLQCACLDAAGVTADMLQDYDPIIYGGGLYAVGINGLALINDNLARLSGKKIIVWATGASRGTQAELDHIRRENFTEQQLEAITPFYLRGGFRFERLPAKEKVLMSLLKVKLQLKKDKTADEAGLLRAYQFPEDHCSREKIRPLVDYARNQALRLSYRETMVPDASAVDRAIEGHADSRQIG